MSAKKQIFVHVEVLQNGEPLDSYRQGINKSGAVSLGRTWPNKLRMPFYPLLGKTKILRIRKNAAHLRLDASWEGFVSAKGQLTKITKTTSTDTRITLKEGDYASLAKGDLRILIKISAEAKAAPIQVKEKFNGSLLRLFWGTKAEVYGFIAGTVCSLMLFTGLIAGLTHRADERPRQLKDLDPSYVLGVINPKHLGLLPETLQDGLNRTRTLDLAIDYYSELAVLMSGGKEKNFRLLLPSTVERMERIHTLFQTRMEKYLDKITADENEILSVKSQAILKIPAAIGESLDSTLVRLEKSIEVSQRSQDIFLKLRREATKGYKQDALYDYNEYKNVKSKEGSKTNEELHKIRVFGQLSDEEAMYAEAEQWMNKAEKAQRRMKAQRESFSPIDDDIARPIAFQDDFSFANFLRPEDLAALNKKMHLIQPAEFGVTRVEKKPEVKEPLLGELDPKLIEKIISRKRFELQLCFELALRRNHKTAGTMKWQWRLDSRGKISDLTLVSSNIVDRQMKNCVMKKIGSWRFPRPKRGSVEITYPFHFKPAKG